MQPLDLTKHAPRSPWTRIGGLYMLARTIDKLRAMLPGGNPGEYKIAGFSERLLRAIGIAEDDLRAVVAAARSDDEIVAWVDAHADRSTYDAYNEAASTRRIADIEDDEFFTRYPLARQLPKETPLFDMLDKDDGALFEPAV